MHDNLDKKSHWYFNKDSLLLALRFGQAHGLPKIIQSKSNVLKISWFIVFLLALIATIYYEIIAMEPWYRNEYDTKVETLIEQPVLFPAVLICFNSYNNSLVSNLKELLLDCKYGFNDCDLDNDFNIYYDLNYGKCYKFITNKTLNQTGSLNGLKLYFNTENRSDLVSIQIAINSPTELSSNNYLNGMIGFVNNVIVSKQTENKLGKPFNDCQNNSNNKSVIDYMIKSNLEYRQKDCFYLTYLNYAGSNCSINGSFLSITQNYWTNFTNEQKNCLNKALISFNKDLDQCPQECDSTNYQTIQSIYRADYLDFNQELNLTLNNESKSLTKINVYFSDFRCVHISQTKRLELIDIIGSVSNILCFFLGASYLTCLEFVEYIFIISGMLIHKLHKKFKKETTSF